MLPQNISKNYLLISKWFVLLPLIAMVMLFTVTLPLSSRAQNTPTTTEQFTGELSKTDNNLLFLNKDNITHTYELEKTATIKRDSMETSIDKLQTGDMLTVSVNTDTQKVTNVESISKQVIDYSKIVIPAVIILALLSLVIANIISKKSKNATSPRPLADSYNDDSNNNQNSSQDMTNMSLTENQNQNLNSDQELLPRIKRDDDIIIIKKN